MKKILFGATCILLAAGCYTPLNNSGVATTKPWLEISAKRTDFDGKQYDSCYRFDLHFFPQEAAGRLDLVESCISACCWRTEKPSVTLDFNKNFKKDLARYGKAYYYTPGQLTLSVSHSNLVNTTRVSTNPKGIISNKGRVKLKYKLVEDPARLAQLARDEAQARVRKETKERLEREEQQAAARPADRKNKIEEAKTILQRTQGDAIDHYFYSINKTYTKQDWTFWLGDRQLTVTPTKDENIYTVTCKAFVKLGEFPQYLRQNTVPCGVWKVNLRQATASPANKLARQIVALQ